VLRLAVLIACGGFMLAGCASKPTSATQSASTPGSTDGLSPAAAALRARLTNTENGLEVRRWIIADRPQTIAQTMVKYAAGPAADAATLRQLKRNGFRFVRIPAQNIDSLLADVGPAIYDATEWHGQVVEWRSLVDRPVETQGQAVAVDGMVGRYETGEFRLMIRSWNVQMETGPHVHFEMTPRRRLVQANSLRRLLGEEGDLEQSFASIALDVQLEAGYAYVIASESPQIEWPGLDGESGEARQTPVERSSRRRGMMDVGPEAAPPPTLGELLLAPPSASKSRGILILVPKIAADLFLPEQLAARARQGEAAPQRGSGDS